MQPQKLKTTEKHKTDGAVDGGRGRFKEPNEAVQAQNLKRTEAPAQ